MTTAVLVPAAGRGERLGGPVPKALVEVGGEPLLVHAVRACASAPSVRLVVVAAPPDRVDALAALLASAVPAVEVVVVAGGGSRQRSVAAALAVLPPEVDVVLVHDAARAFAPPDLVERVAAAVRSGAGAVVPGLRVHDTVRYVGPDGVATETLDRDRLRAVQTPQGFDRELLDRAHREAADDAGAGSDPAAATDDAGLAERVGARVVVVEGSEEAFKVTRPTDLLLAEALVARRAGTS